MENSVVTADTMSCQKKIVEKIIDAKADYLWEKYLFGVDAEEDE